MRYGLDDIRGYDSIIPASYVAAMRALQPQYMLDHNQIAPLYTDPNLNHAGYERTLQSDLLNLLNVRYALTAPDFEMYLPGWEDVYRQEVAIWENESAMPRAFVVDKADWDPRWLAEQGGGFRFAELDVLGGGLRIPRYEAAPITRDSGREKFIDISIDRRQLAGGQRDLYAGLARFRPSLGQRRRGRIRAGRSAGVGEFPGP